ncbi:MAG: biotin--[acetyl-CoA-carboxylase] ligase, partial [Pseudomonadota bacterium]
HQGAQLSFAACLAVADILAALAPEARVSLKWPNDALLNGRKVAGVLLESSGRGSRLDWLAIGIGLNLAAHPPRAPGAAIAPTSLVAEGAAPPTPQAALERLAARLDHWQRLHARAGFEPLRAAWLARASGLGQRIQARTPHTTLSGTYEDVDADGALVLHTAQGRQRIPAADLFFPD